MPKRALKKRLKRIHKGVLVKWVKRKEEVLIWDHRNGRQPLKTGDIGLIVGKVHKDRMNKVEFIIYWQRTGVKRTMKPSDFQIVKRSLTKSK